MYSPANLDSRDELNLHELNCAGYASVVSLGNVPSDPMQWEYGMVLKYNLGGLDSYNTAPSCRACELSGGVCGYAPPHNSFVCVCQNGVNTTTDCYNYLHGQWLSVSSTSYFSCKLILSTFFFSYFFYSGYSFLHLYLGMSIFIHLFKFWVYRESLVGYFGGSNDLLSNSFMSKQN